MTYRYNNYIQRVSARFKANLDGIATYYNFDLGNEYEIAICKALRAILPERYGICRGFVVTAEGAKAGDDIIIYARDRFPSLRQIDENDYGLKQQIPVEAVYAYIEAKHTLTLEGDGPQSLQKANSQVAAVKALPRESMTVKNAFSPYIVFGGLTPDKRGNFPAILNPLFGAIIARQIRIKPGSKPLKSSARIREALDGRSVEADLMIAGSDVVCLPFIEHKEEKTDIYHSAFAIEGKSKLHCKETPGLAVAIGICSMFYALDTIILGNISWPGIIADSLGLPLDV